MNATTLVMAALCSIIGVGLTACASTPADERAGDDLAPLVGSWTLVAIDGEPVAEMLEGDAPAMEIGEDFRITGFAGVNRFSGDVDDEMLDEGVWYVGAMGVTRMMGPPDAMAVEQRFLSSLSGPGGAAVIDGRLIITPEEGDRLRFQR